MWHFLNKSGFAPVEHIIVIGVIIVLNVIFLIIINPVEQFSKARNVQREVHAQVLSDAMNQYIIDNRGEFFPGMEKTFKMIGTAKSGCKIICGSDETAEACLDLTDYLAGAYLSRIPYDPKFGSPEKTYYAVKIGSSGRIVTRACGAESLD